MSDLSAQPVDAKPADAEPTTPVALSAIEVDSVDGFRDFAAKKRALEAARADLKAANANHAQAEAALEDARQAVLSQLEML
jgi:hypothetical protein